MTFKDINKEEFTSLVYEGYTIPQLMKKYGCSRTAIATAKRNFNLVGKTPNSQKVNITNNTKHCFICNTTKNISEFYSNGKTYKGIQKYKPSCRICESSSRSRDFVVKLFNLLTKLHMKYECTDCKLTGPYGLLDFHHRNPEDKVFNVGQFTNTTYSSDTFDSKYESEILKCDILCPTCHRKRHLFRG